MSAQFLQSNYLVLKFAANTWLFVLARKDPETTRPFSSFLILFKYTSKLYLTHSAVFKKRISAFLLVTEVNKRPDARSNHYGI